MATEVWMRGAIEGIAPALQPAAHALLQVQEELEALLPSLETPLLHARPGGAASIGYHTVHLTGSMDRLFTYARGEALSEAQLAALRAESDVTGLDADALLEMVRARMTMAIDELRRWSTMPDELYAPRAVGRKRLPSTVLGLLFHAAEHAQRHAGQVATTARIVRAGIA